MSFFEADYDEDAVPQEPLRIFMFSDGMIGVDDELVMSAHGPHGLRDIVNRLLSMGHDPDRELHVRCAGAEDLLRILLRDAVQQES